MDIETGLGTWWLVTNGVGWIRVMFNWVLGDISNRVRVALNGWVPNPPPSLGGTSTVQKITT